MTENENENENPPLIVTDCCGRLLRETATLSGDTHLPEMCPACHWVHRSSWLTWPDDHQPDHDVHVTCDSSQVDCPGRDWSYVDGQVVKPHPGEGSLPVSHV